MDEFVQVGKAVRGMANDAQSALNRHKPQIPRIEHARDIFDSVVPFEMTFKTEHYDGEETITLSFAPPPNNCCCTNCLCAQCEFFSNTTDTILTMTHDIHPGSLTVLINDVLTTDYVQSSANTITLGFAIAVTDEVKVCYTFEILIFGSSTKCADCQKPAFTELTTLPVNAAGDNIDWAKLIAATAAQGPGGITGYVAATWTTWGGYQPTWAHSTIPGPPGSGQEDRPVSEIPFYNLMYAIDDNPSTCAGTGAPTIIIRCGPGENYTCAAAHWLIGFPRPVKICGITSTDDLTGTSIIGLGLDGTTQPISFDQITNGGETPAVWALDITFVRCGPAGPFGLLGIIGPTLCDIQVCASDLPCTTLQTYAVGPFVPPDPGTPHTYYPPPVPSPVPSPKPVPPPPPPGPPGPIDTGGGAVDGGDPNTIIGVSMGAWGGSSMTDIKGAVNYVSVATSNGGGESSNISSAIAAGLGVVQIRVGPYGAGVQSINASSWAAAAVSVFNAHPTIRAMEILNEPAGSWFWGSGALSQANATAYANLLRTVRLAFNANGSRPKLLASYDGGYSGGSSWGPMVKNADPNVWTYIDGITVHPYGGNTNRTLSALGNRANIANARAATGKDIWLTEVGWPAAYGKPNTGDSFQWTEPEQATNIYNLVTWAKSVSYIKGVIIFTYRDYGSNMWYGVTRGDGSHRKSFEDLRRANLGLPQS